LTDGLPGAQPEQVLGRQVHEGDDELVVEHDERCRQAFENTVGSRAPFCGIGASSARRRFGRWTSAQRRAR